MDKSPQLLRAPGRTLGDLVAPITASGQQRAVGTLLNQQATDPNQAIQNLQGAGPIVPNSFPTAGPASQDIGLLGIDKAMRGRSPAAFGERISAQNAARQTELGALAGTEGDISAAEAARDSQTTALREAAFQNASPADVTPVIGKIDSTLAGPIGKRDIASQALNWLKAKLVDGNGNPETDPQNLYAVRQDVNDAIAGKLGGEQSKFRLAKSQLLQIRAELDNAIETAAPGFKNYLSQYSALSKPIDQMTSLQGLQQSANTTAADMTTGLPFLSPASFSRGLDKVNADPFSGVNAPTLTRLETLRKDLQNSQAVNSPLLRAPGSDTFQNLSLNQNLGSMARFGAKPLEMLYKLAGSDSAINDQLTEAMLNPQRAATLMQKASVPRPDFNFRPYDLGTFFGLQGLTQR